MSHCGAWHAPSIGAPLTTTIIFLVFVFSELTRASKLAVLLDELEGHVDPLPRVERQLGPSPVTRQDRHAKHPLRHLRQLEVNVRRKRYR